MCSIMYVAGLKNFRGSFCKRELNAGKAEEASLTDNAFHLDAP